MGINKLIDNFLFYCNVERRYSVHTIDAYRSDLGSFATFVGKRSIKQALSTESLKAFLNDMVVMRHLSVSTARRRIACLQSFTKYLTEHHGIADPFQVWSPSLKRPKYLPRALHRSAVAALVQPRNADAFIQQETMFHVLLLSATGMRVSELCAIRASDVAADGSSIYVQGKGAKERMAFIGNTCLKKALASRRADCLMTRNDIEAHLFLSSRGTVLRPQTLRRRLHHLAEMRGLKERITPHRFRHTAATILIENGVDIRFVQRLLGHASIATTEIYTRVTDAALEKAVCEGDPVSDFVV
ncbi:MAG: tyrosine-type recombinase/integrase [Gammaproteobacteria bacterium]